MGDKIKIENGWVSSFQDKLQVTAGKFGKLTVLGKDESIQTEEPGESVEEPISETEDIVM